MLLPTDATTSPASSTTSARGSATNFDD
jgi:hypothetical protein